MYKLKYVEKINGEEVMRMRDANECVWLVDGVAVHVIMLGYLAFAGFG
jgi:hypothetical protein